ncbi:hypothetical protein ACIQVA_35520 [Streptomyces microflavus]|uniref:hypothetical protein n=1 Tax=Streptomyces microflavus TaxID=1919 RepID=UPI00382B0F2E
MHQPNRRHRLPRRTFTAAAVVVLAGAVAAGIMMPGNANAGRAGASSAVRAVADSTPSLSGATPAAGEQTEKRKTRQHRKPPTSGPTPSPSPETRRPLSGTTDDAFQGVGTHFDKTGDDGGGCGVPPAQIESENFVALNVFDTPGAFAPSLPRVPVPDSINGVWNNGLNCGRWVEITLGDFCTVANGGAAGQGICRGGKWKQDQFKGATLKAVVTDSCGDPNEWCRSDRNHLDIARGGLARFTRDGRPTGDLETQGAWNNRKISWRFIPAPGYQGDVKIGLAKNASQWYTPVIITNLPDGIRGVEFQENGTWKKAKMTGDNGQRYEIQPTSAERTHFRLRITDAHGKLVNQGRAYSFRAPGCTTSACSALYTPVTYTTG